MPNLFFFDTEIAKSLYAKFPPKKPEFDGYTNIIRDWWIICWAGQWQDSKKVIGSSVIDDMRRFKRDPMDDYLPVTMLYEQLKDADAIIGHNMQKFDWKKFMARVTYHKLDPLDPPKVIDTYLMAKAIGEYSSNSLNYLCKYHKLPTKASNRGNDMWNDVVRHIIDRDLDAAKDVIQEVVDYCAPDVTAVKGLYEFLLPYAPQRFRVNQNLYHGENINGCPCCKSDNIIAKGYRITIVGKYQRFKCNDCGAWSQGKKNLKVVGIK